MHIDTTIFLPFLGGLIAILNPFSTIPYYLSTNPQGDIQLAKKDAKLIAFSVFLILLIGGIIGLEILAFFGLEMRYFRIAGGLLIAYNAFRMTIGTMLTEHHSKKSNPMDEVDGRGLIIPLAMPLTAGPGSIAYVISWFGTEIQLWPTLITCIIIAVVIVYIVIRLSTYLEKALGSLGLKLITRFMGLILLGIGIQSILSNL